MNKFFIPPLTNIFYFHGLDGFLTNEKKVILEPFGNVIAPTYNYRDPSTLTSIKNRFRDADLSNSVFMGTSYGGFVASSLSVLYDHPTLLFNPALVLRTIPMGLDAPLTCQLRSISFFVLGEKDRLLLWKDNLKFINEHIKGPKEVAIEKDMGHHVPADVFSRYVSLFFEKTSIS